MLNYLLLADLAIAELSLVEDGATCIENVWFIMHRRTAQCNAKSQNICEHTMTQIVQPFARCEAKLQGLIIKIKKLIAYLLVAKLSVTGPNKVM